MPAEGWAIELKGERFDVDDAREALQTPFDPWVEDYADDAGNKYALLRTAAWATLTEAGDVTRDAERIIVRLNGAARLIHEDARPLTVGEVFKFDASGKRVHVLFAATGHFQLTGGRVRLQVQTPGKPPPPPAESKIQRWLREAEDDDVRAELLSHIARADNWYDVYKSAELVRKLAGNAKLRAPRGPRERKDPRKRKEKVIVSAPALGPTDAALWNAMWQTANCNRHAPDPIKYPLPTPPTDPQDARKILFKVASKFL
jgi:hypothetical protein